MKITGFEIKLTVVTFVPCDLGDPDACIEALKELRARPAEIARFGDIVKRGKEQMVNRRSAETEESDA